jgi:hypothetical protein
MHISGWALICGARARVRRTRPWAVLGVGAGGVAPPAMGVRGITPENFFNLHMHVDEF